MSGYLALRRNFLPISLEKDKIFSTIRWISLSEISKIRFRNADKLVIENCQEDTIEKNLKREYFPMVSTIYLKTRISNPKIFEEFTNDTPTTVIYIHQEYNNCNIKIKGSFVISSDEYDAHLKLHKQKLIY